MRTCLGGGLLRDCNRRRAMYTDANNIGHPVMPRPRGKQLPNRLCVSLDRDTYTELCAISRDEGVSASWVVRKAVQELVARHRAGLTPELPLQRSAGGARDSQA